MRKFPRNATLT